jgi:glycosyltransferase involved in cell wall biosynthesis
MMRIFMTILKRRKDIDVVHFTSLPWYVFSLLPASTGKPMIFGPNLARYTLGPVDTMEEDTREAIEQFRPERIRRMEGYGEMIERFRLSIAQQFGYKSTQFVCFSQYVKERALIPRDIRSEKVQVLPSGVPRDVFNEKGEGGNKRHEKELLFVGTKNKGIQKGLGVLLRALHKIEKITLTIVGATEIHEGLEQEYEKVSDRVDFAGWVDRADLAKYYQNYDAYVLPSYAEAEATTKIEALSCGTPCIVTDGAGFRENVVGDSALFFKRGDAESLAASIRKFYSNQDYYTRNARLNAENYNIKKTHNALKNIYNEVIC